MKKFLFAIALISFFAINIPAYAQTTASERTYILSSAWKDVTIYFVKVSLLLLYLNNLAGNRNIHSASVYDARTKTRTKAKSKTG